MITLVLLVTMVYSGMKYLSSQDITTISRAKDFIYNGKNFSNVTSEFMPTFKYFDWNVDHELVFKQEWGGQACDESTNFFEVKDLYTWPGTNLGCLEDTKVVLGKCSTDVGTDIDPTINAKVRKWRKGLFCVNYVGTTNKLNIKKSRSRNYAQPTSSSVIPAPVCLVRNAQSQLLGSSTPTTTPRSQHLTESQTPKTRYQRPTTKPTTST